MFLPWNGVADPPLPKREHHLSGFDRLIFKTKLRQLYSPNGMNCYLAANQVLRKDFKTHAKAVTAAVLQASLLTQAKELGRYRYLNSSQISKEEAARLQGHRHLLDAGPLRPRFHPGGAGRGVDERRPL